MKRVCHGASSGFTIVELLIAFGILMTLCAIALPAMGDAINAARIARTVADVRTIGNAAYGYYAETGAVPNSLVDIGYEKQLDPWGHGYQYLGFTINTNSNQMLVDRFNVPINKYFDLYSLGADGTGSLSLSAPAGQDDVIWANDGAYIGEAINY